MCTLRSRVDRHVSPRACATCSANEPSNMHAQGARETAITGRKIALTAVRVHGAARPADEADGRTWSGALQREARQVAGAVSRPLGRFMEKPRGPVSVRRASSLASSACGGCCCVRAHRIHLLPEPRGSPRQSSSRTPICAWHVRWARIARVCEPWGAPWLARLRRGAGAFTRRHGTRFKWEAVRSLF